MRVEVGSMIRVTKPTTELVDWCRQHLVLKNPDYTKKASMHLWLGNTPREIFLYEMHGDALLLPYGCLRQVTGFMRDIDRIELAMPAAKSVFYNADVPLYDYQKKAVAHALEAQYGILKSPAGSGKTQMGIAMAVTLGRRALWLTHTHDLLEQSKKRAEQYVSPTLLGTISEGRVQVGAGITFATVQTMSNLDLSLYRDVWDTIIVDECHRVAGSPTAVTRFSKVLNHLAARHKYGLSATVHRADGMIAATYALLGDVVYDVPEEAVAEKIMTVAIKPCATDIGLDLSFLDTDGTLIYARLINYLTENEERTRQIVGDLVANKTHSCLILSDRVKHLHTMRNALPYNLREQASVIDGKMTSAKDKQLRSQIIDDMRNGKKRFLFATYALAKEGLDIPRLDRLFLTTPQKDYAIVAQSVGRIARTCDGKGEPVVYDYVDNRMQYLIRAYKKRCTTYRKLGSRFVEE